MGVIKMSVNPFSISETSAISLYPSLGLRREMVISPPFSYHVPVQDRPGPSPVGTMAGPCSPVSQPPVYKRPPNGGSSLHVTSRYFTTTSWLLRYFYKTSFASIPAKDRRSNKCHRWWFQRIVHKSSRGKINRHCDFKKASPRKDN